MKSTARSLILFCFLAFLSTSLLTTTTVGCGPATPVYYINDGYGRTLYIYWGGPRGTTVYDAARDIVRQDASWETLLEEYPISREEILRAQEYWTKRNGEQL